ncbi:MAG: hypothetical protein A2284_13215 [Deltaproteobacteria bacterium RIFOXYA12_FULL_61_11]|nr:MAG: hypothetical protein A2284_13215 [Deltaproteobacteria bacterium RIFOXYA12_FULL_61_11]
MQRSPLFPVFAALILFGCDPPAEVKPSPAETLDPDVAACPDNARAFLATNPSSEEVIEFSKAIVPIFRSMLAPKKPACIVCHLPNSPIETGGLVLGGTGVEALRVCRELTEERASDPIVDPSADASSAGRIDCGEPERSLIVLEPSLGYQASGRPHPVNAKVFHGPTDHAAQRIIRWIEQGAFCN